MSKKTGDTRDDLEEFKKLIGSDTDSGEEGITFDSIMAEYKYESVTTRRRPNAPAVDEGTSRLMHVAEEMRKLSGEVEELRTGAPPASAPSDPDAGDSAKGGRPGKHPGAEKGAFEEPFDPQIEEAFFGTPDDFRKAFSPSEHFVRPDEPAEERGEEPEEAPRARPAGPKRSLLKALRAHIRRQPVSEETTPEQACAKLTPYVAALRMRTILAFVLLLPLCYIALAQGTGLPLPGFLHYFQKPYIHLFVTTLLQVLIMLCGTDVLAKGFSDLYHLRPGMESLISVSALASLLNVFSAVALDGFIGLLPYSAVSALSVFMGLAGHYLTLKARRRTYKTASAPGEHDIVTLEDRAWDDMPAFVRRPGDAAGFVARTESPDMTRRVMSVLSPLFLIAALVLAFVVSVGQGLGERFFWAWAVLSASVAPFGVALSTALPFSKVSKRLARVGAAIAGGSAAKALSEAPYAVVGDRDLFPGDMVALNGLKVFGRHSYEKVTSVSMSLLETAGSGLCKPIKNASGTPGTVLHRVSSFEYHEGGGVSGEIGGERILLGTPAFILRMGIRLPQELVIKNALLVAINMDIAGIFAIHYVPEKSVASAIRMLERSGMVIVLGTRDFNLSPTMLKTLFEVDSDIMEYPPVEERLALSDPAGRPSQKPLAVLVREGLMPYAQSIAGGARLHRTARLNLILSLLGTFGALFLAFLQAYIGTADALVSIAPHNMLLYMLLWCVPVLLASHASNRY